MLASHAHQYLQRSRPARHEPGGRTDFPAHVPRGRGTRGRRSGHGAARARQQQRRWGELAGEALGSGPVALHWASPQGRLLLLEGHEPNQRLVLFWDVAVGSGRHVLDLQSFGGLAAHSGPALWVGDAAGGLYVSHDAGEHFTATHSDLRVTCLEWGHERLWACTDNLREGHFLATSTDGGRSFVSVGRFECVSNLPACDAVTSTCSHAWQEWRQAFIEPARALGLAPACGDSAPAPAGGCTAAHGGSAAWLGGWAFCLGLGALTRSRRRHYRASDEGQGA